MTRCLIILAHPEPRSFCGDWARATLGAARGLGWDADLSDLYGQGFDPAERAEHYTGVAPPFDVLRTQETAALPADVRRELDRVIAADILIFHFPLWWFAPPAMLKGWCDRVLAHGTAHDVDHRFDRGRLLGKRALFCVTTGAKEAETGPSGKEGDVRLLLWPLAYTLRYCGVTVLEPAIATGVHSYHEGAARRALEARLGGLLADQARLLGALEHRPVLPFNSDADFDDEGRLKPDAPSYWPFTRHGD